MKNFFLSLFLVTTAALAVLLVVQMNDAKKLETQVESLTTAQKETVATANKLQKEIAGLKSNAKALAQEKEKSRQETEEYKKQIAQLKTDVTDAIETAETAAETAEEGDGASKFAEGLAEMMETPEMRETVRMQLQGAIIDPVYGSLMKDLNMSSADREKFTEILMEKYMAGMDMFSVMQSGDKDAYKKLQVEIEERQQEVNDKIKEMLGDENYKKYEYYQKTEQERMVMGQLNQRLSYSDNAISGDQNEQLIKVMYEEKQAAKDEPGFFNPEKAGPDDLTEERIDDLARIQADINKRVRDRAGSILGTDQLLAFEKFQDALLQQQLMGMRMASQMFKTKKTAEE